MQAHEFMHHDISEFPLVWARHDAPETHPDVWIAEMEDLLGRGQCFVLLVDMNAQTGSMDRQAQMTWQMTNLEELKRLCLAFIAIERDPVALEKLQHRSARMQEKLGLRFRAAASPEKVKAIGREMIALTLPQ